MLNYILHLPLKHRIHANAEYRFSSSTDKDATLNTTSTVIIKLGI